MLLRALSGLPKQWDRRSRGPYRLLRYDTVDAVRKLAPHLKMVHLKDVEHRAAKSMCCSEKVIARIPK